MVNNSKQLKTIDSLLLFLQGISRDRSDLSRVMDSWTVMVSWSCLAPKLSSTNVASPNDHSIGCYLFKITMFHSDFTKTEPKRTEVNQRSSPSYSRSRPSVYYWLRQLDSPFFKSLRQSVDLISYSLP